MAASGISQVITKRPDGTRPRYLGALGHVSALTYSWSNPGGPDQLSCVLQTPAAERPDALDPGRQCQVVRGGRVIWDGRLTEPAPSAAGWQVTATGIGKAGTDFAAVFSNWTAQNDAVNQAITRGLRWVNPGGNSIPSGVWLGQASDSGSMTIDALLNLFCTLGGYTWYVNVTPYGNNLSVYLFPAATLANVNRILVLATPPARTLGGDVNTVWIRYQSSADSAAVATFALTSVTNATATALHGPMEAFEDVSSAGVMTAGQAQALAQSALNRYQRASYAGPFTVAPGELLNPGGVPVDLGLDHCGTIVKAVLASGGYGGEVVPAPAVFMTGSHAWDEDAQTAQVTPFQSLSLSVSGLLGAALTRAGGMTGHWRGGVGGTAGQEQAWQRAQRAKARAAARRPHRFPGHVLPGPRPREIPGGTMR